MAAMAEEEIDAAKADIAQIDEALQLMLIPKDLDDKRAAFVETRAALAATTGAVCRTCSACVHLLLPSAAGIEIISESPRRNSVVAKEVVLRIDGLPTFWAWAYGSCAESGGHRVQRVPVTETQGRTPRLYRGRAG
jgi:peptide chain release factor 1